MRIQLVKGADADGSLLNIQTHDLLHELLEKIPSVDLLSPNPDVIHIMGEWNSHTEAILKDAVQRHIAVVYTPLCALSPWKNATSKVTHLSWKATMVVASGAMEQEYLDDGSTDRHLMLIKNACTTNTTTADDMVTQYLIAYDEAVRINDQQLWTQVDSKVALIKNTDATMMQLCRQFIYAQYLFQRRNIPQPFINDLATLLKQSNYDEDRLADILHLIRLHAFVARLETVMAEVSSLTEGYMPIPSLNDKTTKVILSYLTT